MAAATSGFARAAAAKSATDRAVAARKFERQARRHRAGQPSICGVRTRMPTARDSRPIADPPRSTLARSRIAHLLRPAASRRIAAGAKTKNAKRQAWRSFAAAQAAGRTLPGSRATGARRPFSAC
ncbi:hypothetical protein [Lysobacter enzymogenes]|uniref:hypothetical protein n=1 Tax=Lysobacter enzymogenes TaxID=69 RepID=UPI001AF27DBD|nr:hypothetical protein [Lysobacter enzymogenes]QQQ01605.1 hypothetical protein JHW41_01070 [Lysobacter enzymogenes]